jgi:hypothetical protein
MGEIPRGPLRVGVLGRRDDRVIDDGEAAGARQPAAGRPGLVRADDGHGHDGHAERAGQPERAEAEALDPPVEAPAGLGEDHDRLPRAQEAHRGPGGARVGGVDVHRKGAQPANQPGEAAHAEQGAPRHVVDGPAHRNGREHRVGKRDMVRHDEERARGGNVVDPFEADAEVEAGSEPDDRPGGVDHGRAHGPIVPRPA